MSAQIRSTFSRDDYGSWQCETIGFYVYDPNSTFAGTSYDECAWRFIGNASRYLPAPFGYGGHPIHVAAVALPNMPEIPVLNADTWTEANAYFESHAAAFLAISAIEAERQSWIDHLDASANAMADAELSEIRARLILSS